MKKGFFLALMATVLVSGTALASGGHGKSAHWGYGGHEGPSHWSELSDAYHICQSGTRQSPIDIGTAVHAEFKGVSMAYKPVTARVVYNGHTVQVNYDSGSSMTVDGKTYNLAQFHFHSPSEHVKDGKPYPMEAHLVHVADDGSLAVVGVFMKEGASNPFIADLWKHLPHEVGHEVKGNTLNVADFLPANKAFYHYNGSLTTPPCSEGVKWFVMDSPATVSADQVKQFLGLVHENARPVQADNKRMLLHRN